MTYTNYLDENKVLKLGIPFVDVEVTEGPLGIQVRWSNDDGKKGLWLRTVQPSSQIAVNGIVGPGDRLFQVGNSYDNTLPFAVVELANGPSATDLLKAVEPAQLVLELSRQIRPTTLRFLLCEQKIEGANLENEVASSKTVEPVFQRIVKCVNIMGVPYTERIYDSEDGIGALFASTVTSKLEDDVSPRHVDEMNGIIYSEDVSILTAFSKHILVRDLRDNLRWLSIFNETATAAVAASAPVAPNATRNFLNKASDEATNYGEATIDDLTTSRRISVSPQTLKEAKKYIRENIQHWREMAEIRSGNSSTDRILQIPNGHKKISLKSGKSGTDGKVTNWFEQLKSWIDPKNRAWDRSKDSSKDTGSQLAPGRSARVNSLDMTPAERYITGTRVRLHGLTRRDKIAYNGMPAEIIWTTESKNPVTRVRLLGTPAVYGKEVEVSVANVEAVSTQLQALPGFSSHGLEVDIEDAVEERKKLDQVARAKMRKRALKALLFALQRKCSDTERAKTRRKWIELCLQHCFTNDDNNENEEINTRQEESNMQNGDSSEDDAKVVAHQSADLSPDATVVFYNELGAEVIAEVEKKMDELVQASYTFPVEMARSPSKNAETIQASNLSDREKSRMLHRTESLGVIVRDVHRTYPEHYLFQERGGKGQRMLARVLAVVSEYDPELSYCQGMNFIAGMLLTVFTEAKSLNSTEYNDELENGRATQKFECATPPDADNRDAVQNKKQMKRQRHMQPGTLLFGEQCAFWVMVSLMESPQHRMRRCFIPGLPQVHLYLFHVCCDHYFDKITMFNKTLCPCVHRLNCAWCNFNSCSNIYCLSYVHIWKPSVQTQTLSCNQR